MAVWPEKVDSPPLYASVTSEESSSNSDQEELLYRDILAAKRHRRSRWNYCHAALTLILAVVTIAQSVVLLRTLARTSWPVPEFKTYEKSFYRQIDWEFSPIATSLWANLMPHSGLVAIENPEQYGLKKGLPTEKPNSLVYGVAVTHEYHCLQMIHASLIGLAVRDPDSMDLIYAANTSVVLPQGKLNHLFHCVDYIRQGILCRADTTLESRSESNHEHIDGYNVPHQCRRWEDVYEWMTDNLPPEPSFHEPQSME